MSQVKDIIDGIKHRLPDRVNLYPALNRAVRMISKRLFFHKASMIQGVLSVSISADASSGSLPDDFWGLISRPYRSTDTYTLMPVPDKEIELKYNNNSTPIYYKVSGTTLHLYPGSSGAITINGDYWKRPTKLTKTEDTMPFNELFDDAIEEALIHIYVTGDSTGNPNDISLMQNFINKAVDEVAPYIDKQAPQRVPDNVGLDYMTNEDW